MYEAVFKILRRHWFVSRISGQGRHDLRLSGQANRLQL